jgi:glycoprotease/Kae1 family metallohydrolase
MGIESSCDDTGVAIVAVDDARDARPRILANVVCSQAEIHAPFGGVVPKLAQEAHQTAIDNAVDSALRDAGVRAADLEAVGVTIGPGLSLCLRVGVSKARELRAQHGVPVIDVHHMEAHALVARLAEDVPFPFLCLLVSGGHNLMLVVEGIGRFVQLGTTLDDALGECYDKTARALEALAREGDEDAFSFPVPLKKRRTCDFSFAGLKTSVRLAIEREQQKATPEEVRGSHARVQVTRQAITENAIPLTSKLARDTFRMFPGEAFPAASRRTSPRRSKRPRQSTWTSGSEGRSSGRGRATPRSST